MRAALIVLVFFLAALGMREAAAENDPVYAKIETSMGDIVVALDPERAPLSVENFVQYAEDGHYDRTIIHRVVKGFVIQGGGFSRYFNKRRTRAPIAYEGGNGLKNKRGALAMARTSDPDSADSQWYINIKDNPALDEQQTDYGVKPGYAVFGRVVSGMDVVDAIAALETGPGGPFDSEVPVTPVIVKRIDPTEWSAVEDDPENGGPETDDHSDGSLGDNAKTR